jgi:hypothetical protein
MPARSGGERGFAAVSPKDGKSWSTLQPPSGRPGTHNVSLERTRLARAEFGVGLPADSPYCVYEEPEPPLRSAQHR